MVGPIRIVARGSFPYSANMPARLLQNWPYRVTHPAQRHRLLGAALLLLHGAVLTVERDLLQASLMLTHVALFLLWQPFFDSRRPPGRLLALATVLAAVGLIVWGGWVVVGLWMIVLLSLIAGEGTASRRDAIAQGLAVGYLFLGLLIAVAPGLFDVAGADAPILHSLLLAAGVLPLAMIALQASPAAAGAARFDHLRSAGVTLVTLLLLASAVLASFQTDTHYALALLYTLPAAALLLLVLGWIGQRASTHSLVQLLWNRYLLNLGTPFEQYLLRLTGPGAQELRPGAYLDHVLSALDELDWIAGVEAHAPNGGRRRGNCDLYPTRLIGDQLALTVYTRYPPSPALRVHIQLLLRLAHQLWDARRREAELQSQARIRAVHETGARLTHDTKNLLQSLESLTAAVSETPPERAHEALQLVQRQLPPIQERLQATLDKLREPDEAGDDGGDLVALDEWWAMLQARYVGDPIEFDTAIGIRADRAVPGGAFDTVIENLLENARRKQAADDSVEIHARLAREGEAVRLEVIDGGEAIPPEKANHLFDGTLSGAHGLGVGLLQAARMAAHHGYRLELTENRPGHVRFTLTGALRALPAESGDSP